MSLYGKGISVASGFDLAGAPVDQKYIVENLDEANAYVSSGIAYAGMQIYNKANKTIYVYNGTSFQTMSASAGSAEIDLSNYVDLTSAQEISGSKTFTGDNYFVGGIYVPASTNISFYQNTPNNQRGYLNSTSYTGNAASATKAMQDGDGNVIVDTYETKANAIVDLSVTGTTITITKGDGTTETATTQDTNTDTKVTNTLATTTKAYLTATTSAETNTGTQVFDTGVYLDSTAGRLVAGSFAGNGANITSLSATNITSGTLTADRLSRSGVSAGTYPKVTVDAYGRVTAGASLTASDIPNLTLAKITDAGTAADKDVGTASGNIPIINADGKLDNSIIPAIAITDTFVVGSQSEMLALDAQTGDIAIRTDVSATYILAANGASTLANWKQLPSPSDGGFVTTVNGKTGVVTLTTSDIAEGSNLYFTDARATSNFNTNFAAKSVTGLSDGANVCLTTDELIIDCGNA